MSRIGAALAVWGVLLAGACRKDTGAARGDAFRPLAVGDLVPAYAVATLAGDSARVAPGEPVTLLNVWATWCTSCREEMATLQALHDEFARRGVRVLAVSVDGGSDAGVRSYVSEQHFTFPVGHDPQGQIEETFRIVGVPTTLLIDAGAALRWEHIGPITGVASEARSALAHALGAGTGGGP